MKQKNPNRGVFGIALGILFFLSFNLLGQGNLPNPASNFQSIAAGRFVIPMDNSNQAIVPAGQASFNLKAYGLINQFLQNGIPVKWAINSNKPLNGIDFSGQAERIAPSAIPSALIDFRSGPFIVPDTVLPCGLSTTEIIKNFGNNVTVFKLTNTTTVDIRYTLTHRPKIAVFNNGGNQLIHTNILDAASIGDYDVMDAADIGNLINCYTFASEPHADESEVSLAVVDGIRAFVLNGGNFLAQCHAIDTYENRGFFHTTSGISVVNTTATHQYPNANLSYSQLNGGLQLNEGGSIVKWTLANGSSWRPTSYPSVTHNGSDTIIAMGANLTNPNAPGGNVFYLGGHDYSKGGGGINLATLERVNGLRMYLNAVFVPSGNSNGAWANAGVPSITIGCSDSVQLGCTLTGPPGSTFLWTPATGLSCTTCSNPIARPSSSTTYQVQVTNGCVATDTVRVIVAPKPVAQYTNTTVCQGASTSFSDQTSDASFWRWHFGDSASGTSNISMLQNPTHTFSKAGNFTVTLVSGIHPTCADTVTKIVSVSPLPVLSVNSSIICFGQTTSLTASGASTYLWPNGSSGNSISVNPTVSTSFKLIGTTAGCRDSILAKVTVSPPLVSNSAVEKVTCFGKNDGTATVSVAGGIPKYTFRWNTTPIQTTAKAIQLKAGTYQAIIQDSIGCADTVKAVVPEGDPFPIVRFSSPSGLCENACIQFTDSSSVISGQIQTWLWDFGNPTEPENTSTLQHPSHCYTKAGKYTVALTVSTKQGCAASLSKNKAIEVVKSPTVQLGPDLRLCPETEKDAIPILDAGAGLSYKWEPTGETTQTISPKTAGTYKVVVTNAQNCTAQSSLTIQEVCPPRLFTANSFSPNGDGINDEYTTHHAHIGSFQMFIFNRWGEIIFETTDKNEAWNGIYKGEPMPIGVYPWLITYTGDSEEYYGPYRLKGSVTVVK